MANPVKKLAEVQESTWLQLLSGKILIGLFVFIVAGALLYASKFIFHQASSLNVYQILLSLIAVGALGVVGSGIYTGIQARKSKGFGFTCPYCDKVNGFDGEVTEDFACEFCSRTVHFQGGQPIPVRTVNCPFCETEHRVATNIQRYLCDHCNRPLELKTLDRTSKPTVSSAPQQATPTNFDVVLLAVDRRHEIELAMKLQNLLIVNLPEARRLMATATTTTPLVVSHNLPQRKAEAIRRQLQDIGGTASLRPVSDTPPQPKMAR